MEERRGSSELKSQSHCIEVGKIVAGASETKVRLSDQHRI